MSSTELATYTAHKTKKQYYQENKTQDDNSIEAHNKGKTGFYYFRKNIFFHASVPLKLNRSMCS